MSEPENPNALAAADDGQRSNGSTIDEPELALDEDRPSDGEAEGEGEPTLENGQSRRRRPRRTRVPRSFPAFPFEEAMDLAEAIQQHGAGLQIRRLRLFEILGRSPDSGPSRQMISNSVRYGLTTGSYSSEWLALTPEGHTATSEDASERERARTRFQLAIERIPPFRQLYEQFQNNRLPAKSVLADHLRDGGMSPEEASEAVDTFLLNAKFVGILQNLAGAERILPLDHVLDTLAGSPARQPGATPTPVTTRQPARRADDSAGEGTPATGGASEPWDRICFYVTPIGEDGSEQRMHSDLFLGSIIEPALEEFDLTVIRADRITQAGMISRQVIEHIMYSRLVIADLSFHNPNVFYELALRHMTGKPTIQVSRTSDRLPFDVDQVRTIRIDTSSIYALVPQLEVHRSAITSLVRRALESPDSVDSPVTPFIQRTAATR